MNSGSEETLSMDDLMARNRPAHMKQNPTPAQEKLPPTMPPIIIQNTVPWELVDQLIQTQQSILWKLGTIQSSISAKASADDLRKLTQSVEQLRTMIEQAGKKKERKHLPRFRLHRLHLPRRDGPAVISLAMALIVAVLLLLWYLSDGDLSNLSTLFRQMTA